MTRELTQARVIEAFDYRDDGALIWRIGGNGRKAGDRAGSVNVSPGRRMVRIDRKRYPTSHVIWLRETGAFPKHQLRHVDGNNSNDRLDNLREVTPSQSAMNKAAPRNRLGVRGVSSEHNGYRAVIKVNRKFHYLGHFQTVEEASAAYQAARLKFFGPEFGKLPWSTPRLEEAVS